MSDPVTNIEIEDVLSSIRRLVSDEARANERSEKELSFSSDTPPQAVELQEKSDESSDESFSRAEPKIAPALVLTPALRIETDAVEQVKLPEFGEASASDVTPETVPALILTQDDAAKKSDESSEDDETSEDNPVDFSEQNDAEETAQSVHEMKYESLAPSEDYGEPEEPSAHEMDDAPSAEVDFSVPVADIDDAVEHQQEQEHVSDFAHDVDDHAEIDDDEEPLTIEDKIAALEALISRTDGDFEPDGAETGGNAGRPGRALPWEESQEPRASLQDNVLPDPEEASQSAVFSDGAAAFQRAHMEAVGTAQAELEANATEALLENEGLGSVLDEEALRDMVSEIVRQELQGPLGERITRNVRKLVRREIYRALAANELG